MKSIRAGSGFGDTLYLYPIVKHLLLKGESLCVRTNYPEVFADLNVPCEAFSKTATDIVAHYVMGKQDKRTTQYEDMCRAARLDCVPPLSLCWEPRNEALLDDLRQRAAGRRMIVVHGGRAPMARTDGFGAELLPDQRAFIAALSVLDRDRFFMVRIGKATHLYPLPVELDLNNQTALTDIIDIASAAAGFVAQCSFIVPLSEMFDAPYLAVWAAKGLVSKDRYISAITPQKVLHKTSSSYVVDDWPAERIQEKARAFFDV